jgi:hypothetical protein
MVSVFGKSDAIDKTELISSGVGSTCAIDIFKKKMNEYGIGLHIFILIKLIFVLPYQFSTRSVALDAKHANDKAAKKANANRPRKSRPSDINRRPTSYPTWDKPPEYTISEN